MKSRSSILAWCMFALLAAGCGPEAELAAEPAAEEELGVVQSALDRSCDYCTALSCQVDAYHRVFTSLSGSWSGGVFYMTGYNVTYTRTGGFTQGSSNNEYIYGRFPGGPWSSPDWAPVGQTVWRDTRNGNFGGSYDGWFEIQAYFDRPNASDPMCKMTYRFYN